MNRVVSKLIREIVAEAEHKFGVVDDQGFARHVNDGISVWIFPNVDDTWQVGLQRATKGQLAAGEFPDFSQVHFWQTTIRFYTEEGTLLRALHKLHRKVLEASRFDF